MSFTYTRRAWDVNIPASPKLVLLGLADYADDDGKCWPSQTEIARRTGQAARTVRANLAWLEKQGFIARHARSTRDGRTSDLITVLLPQAADHAACASGKKLHVADDAPQPAESARLPANAARNPINDPIKKPITHRGRATPSDGNDREQAFERLVASFPRRDVEHNVALAKKRFFLALDAGNDPETIISGAERQARHDEKTGRTGTQYVADLANWIRDERWKQWAITAANPIQKDPVHLKTKIMVSGKPGCLLWIQNRTPAWRRLERLLIDKPRLASNGAGHRKMPSEGEKGWFFEEALCIEAGLIESSPQSLAA